MYELNITDDLKTLNNKSLQKPFVGYFYHKTYNSDNPLVSISGYKQTTVIISDIHMGDQRSIDKGYGWFKENKKKLEAFLEYLIDMNKIIKTLVINGDFFDEWVAPMNVETFADESGNNIDQHEFVGQIIKANQSIINKFKELHNVGVEIVYVPGNHDMLVTENDFDTYFGKGVIKQARDANGLGKYEPSKDIVIEHGHRYDYFNAPDPLSNKEIDNVTSNSILPPGFFVTKIASSSDMENLSSPIRALSSSVNAPWDNGNWLELQAAWGLILSKKPIKPSISGDSIKTGIDGYISSYTIDNVKKDLYKHAHQAADYTERLTKNMVPWVTPMTLEIGLAAGAINSVYAELANLQYIKNWNFEKRIVVFGHTHEALLSSHWNYKGWGAVYANSGTWIDEKWAPGVELCTFVTITNELNEKGEGQKEVGLYSFSGKEYIRNIKVYRLNY